MNTQCNKDILPNSKLGLFKKKHHFHMSLTWIYIYFKIMKNIVIYICVWPLDTCYDVHRHRELPVMLYLAKGRHKRESKNAKQMRNTKQNCFSHSSVSPRNDKQCSAKQCFANQTNRSLAGFVSRSDLFRDNARLTKHRRKVNQRHIILKAMYTTLWLEIDCWLAVSHMFR